MPICRLGTDDRAMLDDPVIAVLLRIMGYATSLDYILDQRQFCISQI